MTSKRSVKGKAHVIKIPADLYQRLVIRAGERTVKDGKRVSTTEMVLDTLRKALA